MRGLCGATEVNAPPVSPGGRFVLFTSAPAARGLTQGATEHVRGGRDLSICLSICQVSVFTDLIQVQGGEWEAFEGKSHALFLLLEPPPL